MKKENTNLERLQTFRSSARTREEWSKYQRMIERHFLCDKEWKEEQRRKKEKRLKYEDHDN